MRLSSSAARSASSVRTIVLPSLGVRGSSLYRMSLPSALIRPLFTIVPWVSPSAAVSDRNRHHRKPFSLTVSVPPTRTSSLIRASPLAFTVSAPSTASEVDMARVPSTVTEAADAMRTP